MRPTPMNAPLLLINMPFAAIQFPSLQLGLLQALAKAGGVSTRSVFPSMEFARRIGPTLYNNLSHHRGVMIGEWLFGQAAFGGEADPDDTFQSEFAATFADIKNGTGVSERELRRIRTSVAPAYVDEIAQQLIAGNPRVVGFTSTFEQNVASIAVARAIKELRPDIVTLFGGANFDGPMGAAYMRAIPWIDACVIGEADNVFVPLVKALIAGEEPPTLEGVLMRNRLDEPEAVGRASFAGAMDALPTPDYDDYFFAIEHHGLDDTHLGRPIFLPFESSRGCWWGEKHHCTFCGLNALGMGFRAKSAKKVVQEIAYLTERHRINRFTAVDNILSPKLMEGLAQEFSLGEYDYDLFYEIKANLTRDKIRSLFNAGIKHVQPGIESLSTHVLKLMRKGITATQNVNALRWMGYYGIEVLWNIIYGFPGETKADYRRQLAIIARIHHLPAPKGVGRIWLERFSPVYNQRDEFGFVGIRPGSSYGYIYPRSVEIDKAAYFFDGYAPDTVSDAEMESTVAAVREWQAKWKGETVPFLTFVKTHAGIHISDGRAEPSQPINISYREPAAAIYSYCSDLARARHSIARHIQDSLGVEIEDESLTAILERFVSRGFMLAEDDVYLSLALPAYRPA